MTARAISKGQMLEAAFEYPVPAPPGFLRFLLAHPERMRWPMVAGGRRRFGSELTMRYRSALLDGPAAAHDEAIEIGSSA